MKDFSSLRRQLVCLIGMLAIVTISPKARLNGQDTSADPLAEAAPFIDETTFLLARIEPTAFDDLDSQIQAHDASAEPMLGLMKVMRPAWKPLQSFAAGQPVYVSAGIPLASGQKPLFVFRRGSEEPSSPMLPGQWASQLKPYAVDDYAVLSPRTDAKPEGGDLPEETHQRFAAGFASVSPAPVQVVVLAPEHLRRTYREIGGALPAAWGGGSSEMLAEDLQWVALGIDIEQRVAEVVVQAEDESAAERWTAELPKRLRTAHALRASQSGSLASSVPTSVLDSLVEWVQPRQQKDQLRVRLNLTGADGPANHLRQLVEYEMRQAEERASSESFRRILLALHNYHATYNRFPVPADGRDEQGRARLSWRVYLLPFLGQEELYRRFRLDEPWNSPHNQALLTEMPAVYRPRPEVWNVAKRRAHQPGHTACLAVQGPGTALGSDRPIAFRDIIDGSSNTAFLVEAAEGNLVPWTAPEDFQFDEERPLSGLHLDAQGRWMCGLGDGRVVHLSRDMAADDVNALFHIADEKTVDLQQHIEDAAAR